jgi:adenosylcobinamide-GDP ribazoletransferase
MVRGIYLFLGAAQQGVKALFMCFGMFTALPVFYRPWDEALRPLMIACLPLVGLILGSLWLAAVALLRALSVAPALAAAALVILPILMTGGLHLDGYMDTADAVLSWRPLEKRLEILKDPHTGSFSVIALCCLLLAGYGAALSVLSDGRGLLPLLFIPAVSRACSAFCVSRLKPLAHSEYAGRTDNAGAVSGVLFAVVCILFSVFAGWHGVLSCCAVAAGYALTMGQAHKIMGGFSGDLAGCALSVGEVCGLIAMAVV